MRPSRVPLPSSRSSLRRPRSSLGLVALFGAPAAVLGVLRTFGALDVQYRDVQFHLVVVTGIAACALVVALAAARAAAPVAQHGPVWLAVGCVGIGMLMFAHGLLTPGVNGRTFNMWVGRAPYLAVTMLAVALVLAGRPRNARTSRVAIEHGRVLLLASVVGLGAFVALVHVRPLVLHGAGPLPGERRAEWVVAFADIAMLLGAAQVHWRRWVLGRDPVQFALVLAGAMSSAAMLSMRLGELWRLSWWDYHGYLLAGFASAVYAIAVRSRRSRAVDDVLVAVFDTDPMVHIQRGYPASLLSLVRAVEVKDAYTHGHSERTAVVAVQLALRLGVDESTLRAVARGAYLHDVGKIAIADEILNKPGRLTPEERAEIERHPKLGHDLVAPTVELAESLPVILHHHERWDGAGYPHRLHAAGIPLEARIVAIADVWDALTSDRSYRRGIPPTAALAHISAGRGTHFDPRLVDAFVGLAADWGYRLDGEEGDAEEAIRAAETCHASAGNHS